MNSACPPPVTFVYADFIAAYGIFAPLSEQAVTNYFTMATTIFANNTENPAFCDGVPTMTSIAYALTAHIAWLLSSKDSNGNPTGAGGQVQPTMTGRIASANQGSVSVTTDYGDLTAGSPSQPWYMTTIYGQLYWTMTAKYRTGRPVLNPTYPPSPVRGGLGGVFGVGWGRRGCRGCS